MKAILNVASELVAWVDSESPIACQIFIVGRILVEHFLYIIYIILNCLT